MGAALAHQLIRGEHSLTVWNRSAQKMQPFIDLSANGADSIVEAITASPSIIICVSNYADTYSMLDDAEIKNSLQNRIVVQLSTGTPLDAVEAENWFQQYGAKYIDGAILGGPGNLDTDVAKVVFSGPESVYATVQPQLCSLCANTLYLGDNIRAASALDLAWLCRHYGMFLGITHGVVLCESEAP